MPHPSWFDWLTVTAIFFGPLFALTAQRGLDRLRDKKQRRYLIYTTIMSQRSDPLNPDHVRALNSLDAVFDGRSTKDGNIRQAWARVLAHVGTDRASNSTQWDSTLLDLRVDLYQALGKAVGYDHTVEYIKTHLYAPQHYGEVWADQNQIRRGLAQALTPYGLKVIVASPSVGESAAVSRLARGEGA